MIDNINRAASIKKITKKNVEAKRLKSTSDDNKLSHGLVHDIINEIKQTNDAITPQLVQHHIVLKTLSNSLGNKITQEPKFKELYQFISKEMSQNKAIQTLIDDTIKLHQLY